MQTVTVSSKYQVVIPKAVRKSLGIKPGQRMQVFQFENRIEYIPFKNIKEMRGFLKGIDTTILRD